MSQGAQGKLQLYDNAPFKILPLVYNIIQLMIKQATSEEFWQCLHDALVPDHFLRFTH